MYLDSHNDVRLEFLKDLNYRVVLGFDSWLEDQYELMYQRLQKEESRAEKAEAELAKLKESIEINKDYMMETRCGNDYYNATKQETE